MRVERICSWCGEHQGWVEWEHPPKNTQLITHTICPSCSEKIVRELDPTESEFINCESETNCHEKEIVK